LLVECGENRSLEWKKPLKTSLISSQIIPHLRIRNRQIPGVKNLRAIPILKPPQPLLPQALHPPSRLLQQISHNPIKSLQKILRIQGFHWRLPREFALHYGLEVGQEGYGVHWGVFGEFVVAFSADA
jgi:hypothetical protein